MVKEFIIYGIRERHSANILYIGYACNGKTNGMTAARNLFPDEMDLIGVNFQELVTDNHDEAIYLANLYRHKLGLKVSQNRMKFGNTIDEDSVWFEFELPVMSENDKRHRDLKRAAKLLADEPVRKLIAKVDKPPLAKNAKRVGVRFVDKHKPTDVNGFVTYYPTHIGRYMTWKVELENQLIYG